MNNAEYQRWRNVGFPGVAGSSEALRIIEKAYAGGAVAKANMRSKPFNRQRLRTMPIGRSAETGHGHGQPHTVRLDHAHLHNDTLEHAHPHQHMPGEHDHDGHLSDHSPEQTQELFGQSVERALVGALRAAGLQCHFCFCAAEPDVERGGFAVCAQHA